jgi:hypothetical protein
MKLPENAVGPTDIQQYRSCPRRFGFGMRRHSDAGEHPEAQSTNTAYGSAIHEAIAFAEVNDASDEQAIQRAFDLYAKWLEPEDLERLRIDLRTYRERDYIGVRTVAVEEELRMPLFEMEGTTVYLRTRIDRLYQRLDNPAVFVHVDYKSSRWPKSAQQVHEDIQLWLTNLIVHDVYPECEVLAQVYDQLNFGQLPTRKSAQQRALIRDWAEHQVRTILADEELAPKKNEWCPWCPIMLGCPVVEELTDYARSELAALAPEHKQGRRTVVELDPDLYGTYAGMLEDVGLARKTLDRFDEAVRGVLRDMPTQRREQLGYELSGRTKTTWPVEAMRAAHEVLGDEFYDVVSLTKTALEHLGTEAATTVLDMAVIEDGSPFVKRRK